MTTITRTQTLEIVHTGTGTHPWANTEVPTVETRYIHRGDDVRAEIPGFGSYPLTDGFTFDLVTIDYGHRIETQVFHIVDGKRGPYDFLTLDATAIMTLIAMGY